MRIWSAIVESLETHSTCAVVTVAAVRGSAPREAGARMLVLPGGEFRGSIGGGHLEWQALAGAERALDDGLAKASMQRYALGPELGQCCGGSVRVLTEVFTQARLHEASAFAAHEVASFSTRGEIHACGVERQITPNDGLAVTLNGTTLTECFGSENRRVYLFGAGHVGRALMLALAALPFDVLWIDERAAAFPTLCPANVTPIQASQPVQTLNGAPLSAFVVVMTHSHARDLDIVHAALAARRFAYVGVIGSTTKRARFCQRLRAAGVEETLIDQLICPIGIGAIVSKQPGAIAVSVAAQLLARDEAAMMQPGTPMAAVVAVLPGVSA